VIVTLAETADIDVKPIYFRPGFFFNQMEKFESIHTADPAALRVKYSVIAMA
jgi:hypothetical protein